MHKNTAEYLARPARVPTLAQQPDADRQAAALVDAIRARDAQIARFWLARLASEWRRLREAGASLAEYPRVGGKDRQVGVGSSVFYVADGRLLPVADAVRLEVC